MSFSSFTAFTSLDQGRGQGAAAPATTYVIKPARVFDGDAVREGWAVVVRGQRIESAGPAAARRRPPAP